MKNLGQLGISPTPWSMKTWQASDDYGTIVESANHNTVCDCSWSALGDGQGEIDAYLIAAAPELYEALREAVVEFCHNCEDTNIDHCRGKCFVAKWRDALAKASGEEAAK